MPTEDLIQLRGGTLAAWTMKNPIPKPREPCLELPAVALGPVKVKYGDGIHHYLDLPYAGGGGDDDLLASDNTWTGTQRWQGDHTYDPGASSEWQVLDSDSGTTIMGETTTALSGSGAFTEQTPGWFRAVGPQGEDDSALTPGQLKLGDITMSTAQLSALLNSTDPYQLLDGNDGAYEWSDDFAANTDINAYSSVGTSGDMFWTSGHHMLTGRIKNIPETLTGAMLRPIGSPWAEFSTVETALHCAGPGQAICTLFVADGDTGSDNAAGLYCYWNAGSFSLFAVHGTIEHPGATVDAGPIATHPDGLRIRLMQIDADTIHPQVSPDGINWADLSEFAAGFTWDLAWTPTHVGLAVSTNGENSTKVIAADYLRRT